MEGMYCMNTEQGSVTEKKWNLLKDSFLIALLFGWAFFVNRQIRISGLYMDDLYMWSCYGEQSFLKYVFPLGSTRFRFVYWFFAWLELGLVGNHIGWIVPINILLNAGLAAVIYAFAKRLSHSAAVSFLAGFLFLSSRFAYYQIGQLLGLMETMGIFFALAMCFCLFRYLHERNGSRYFYLAVLFYFLNCFTHERYLVLFPMLLYALVIRKERDVRKPAVSVLVFAAVLAIRRLTIGTLSPAGTGGTQVAETVTRKSILQNLFAELCYVFGINHGPDHLNGLPWHYTPGIFKVLIVLADFVLLLFVLQFLFHMAERHRYGLPIAKMFADIFLLIGFMAGCAVASAVTIRVEMRWVYVVWVFMILLGAYLFGAQYECRARREADTEAANRFMIGDFIPAALLVAFVVLMLPVELFYRTKYPNIYLFLNQKRYNSLADETYGKYGDDIFGKQILIIGNSYEMSDFTAETFFKTFSPGHDGGGITVRHVKSFLDFGQVTKNMLVLKEDTANNLFNDITDAVRSIKLNIDYGYYRDGWMDQNAEISVMTARGGSIHFEFLYPGNLTGSEEVTIERENGEKEVVPLRTNMTNFTLQADGSQIILLKLSCNFVMPGAEEQRGRDPLSVIVNISTD